MDRNDANLLAAAAMQNANPAITDICPAGEVIPALEKMTLLHAGPPIPWENMLEIQRAAVMGAVLYEGWAESPEKAVAMAAKGEIHLIPCNDVDAVGGLAGVTSPSMPVVVATSADGKQQAYCRLWEPYLVFGYHDQKTIESLKWLESSFAPALRQGIQRTGPLSISALISAALQMGDDVHSRKNAIALLLIKAILPGMIKNVEQIRNLSSVVDFWTKYDAVSLSFVIAAAKVMSMAASSVKESSVITVISTNGFEMGIQLSGTGKHWFTAPSPAVTGNLGLGFTGDDASPAVGDSAIAEVIGLGGCALAAAPKAASNTTGRMEEAINFTRQTQQIAVTQHKQWRIPSLDDMGTPLGLDARKCLELKLSPPLAATIPHIKAGNPPVGAGIARLPESLLADAVHYLDVTGIGT